jgi:hypothetical protein
MTRLTNFESPTHNLIDQSNSLKEKHEHIILIGIEPWVHQGLDLFDAVMESYQ